MEFDLHGVKKIIASNIGGHNKTSWRDIVIEMENGERLQINLYSQTQSNLIIKK